MNDIKDMVKTYTDWLFEKFKYKEVDGAIEVETPYVNHLDDYIRIYLQKIDANKFIITDDGQTINELEMINIDLTSKTREKIIHEVTTQFNVTFKNDILVKESNFENFAQNKHDFLQAILRLYDLTFTTRDKVKNLFYEEVKSFLFENDVYGSSLDVSGETGIKHHIDYFIGPTKDTPEILINFVNNADYNSITSDAYTYRDVKGIRPHPRDIPMQYKIIVNDIDNKVPNKVIQVAEHENIDILYWSKKDQLIKNLRQPA